MFKPLVTAFPHGLIFLPGSAGRPCASEFVASRSTDQLIQNIRELTHTQRLLESLKNILVTMRNAETGQRGYLLTGKEYYLHPYEGATGRVSGVLAALHKLTAGDPTQQHNCEKLAILIRQKRPELATRLAPLHPETKVLYMSGYTDNAIVHHGVLDPGTHFLQKPFVPETLILKIREVLDA